MEIDGLAEGARGGDVEHRGAVDLRGRLPDPATVDGIAPRDAPMNHSANAACAPTSEAVALAA